MSTTVAFYRRRCLYGPVLAAVLGLAATGAAHAGDNPGYDRPGIGFTPSVLAAGDLMWEQGLPDWSHAGEADVYTADTLVRVGLGGAFELQLGSSYNYATTPDWSESGRGSSSVGLKFALPSSGPLSWGVLGSVTLTDGDKLFANQKRNYLLGVAANYQLNRDNALGAYVESTHNDFGNTQTVAVNAGHAFSASVGAYVEVAWMDFGRTPDSVSMAGAGITWTPTPNVQLDASFRQSLDSDVDQWQAGLGFAIFFGGP